MNFTSDTKPHGFLASLLLLLSFTLHSISSTEAEEWWVKPRERPGFQLGFAINLLRVLEQ